MWKPAKRSVVPAREVPSFRRPVKRASIRLHLLGRARSYLVPHFRPTSLRIAAFRDASASQ
jgi:hypothetical protein